MVRQAGFEPTTPWFVARYSIQLSYWRTSQFCTRFIESGAHSILRQKEMQEASAKNSGLTHGNRHFFVEKYPAIA